MRRAAWFKANCERHNALRRARDLAARGGAAVVAAKKQERAKAAAARAKKAAAARREKNRAVTRQKDAIRRANNRAKNCDWHRAYYGANRARILVRRRELWKLRRLSPNCPVRLAAT